MRGSRKSVVSLVKHLRIGGIGRGSHGGRLRRRSGHSGFGDDPSSDADGGLGDGDPQFGDAAAAPSPAAWASSPAGRLPRRRNDVDLRHHLRAERNPPPLQRHRLRAEREARPHGRGRHLRQVRLHRLGEIRSSPRSAIRAANSSSPTSPRATTSPSSSRSESGVARSPSRTSRPARKRSSPART